MHEFLGKVIKYDVLNNVGLVIIKANITITQEHLNWLGDIELKLEIG